MPTKFGVQVPSSHGITVRFENRKAGSEYYAENTALAGIASEAFQLARDMTRRAHSLVISPEITESVLAEAVKYFFVSGPADFALIRPHVAHVIKIIADGLASDTVVKVAGTSPASSWNGQVKFNDEADFYMDSRMGQKVNRDASTMYVENVGINHVRSSKINLASHALQSNDKDANVRLIIHEASHRFAGTNDAKTTNHATPNGYFDNVGSAPRCAGHLTRDLAQWNADSYAWFIFKIVPAVPNTPLPLIAIQ